MMNRTQQQRRERKIENMIRAQAAYVAQFERINGLLAKIHKGIVAHENGSDEKHWGHVGDLGHLADQLQNLSDQINGEGEYAE
jgi:hypothetical protein